MYREDVASKIRAAVVIDGEREMDPEEHTAAAEVVADLRQQAAVLRSIRWYREAAVLAEVAGAWEMQLAPGHERDSYQHDVERVNANADPATCEAWDALQAAAAVAVNMALPRRDSLESPTGDEWIREDPTRLAGLVVEPCKFSADELAVVTALGKYADELGIEDTVAETALIEGLKRARANRRGGRRHAR